MTSRAKVPALKLSLGGAPSTWHSLSGLLGFYHPDIPTPVGGPGELPLDAAKDAAKDKGSPVELVQITEAEAEKSRQLIGEQLTATAAALRSAGSEATQQQVDATVDALAGAAGGTNDDEEA